jgi:hypothetical protein
MPLLPLKHKHRTNITKDFEVKPVSSNTHTKHRIPSNTSEQFQVAQMEGPKVNCRNETRNGQNLRLIDFKMTMIMIMQQNNNLQNAMSFLRT